MMKNVVSFSTNSDSAKRLIQEFLQKLKDGGATLADYKDLVYAFSGSTCLEEAAHIFAVVRARLTIDTTELLIILYCGPDRILALMHLMGIEMELRQGSQ